MSAPLTLRDFEQRAHELLDPVHWDFFAGGARDEVTVRANDTGFARLRLVPRILRGSKHRELGTNLLGCRTSMPVVLSPTAFHKIAHTDGELATARAAAAAEVIMIVSMAATTSLADIASAAREVSPEANLWFQLYLQPDLDFTETLVRRAEEAGCRALVVTVDSPVFGVRERDHRNGFRDLPAGMCCENLRDPASGRDGDVRQIEMSPELSWDHIAWLRRITGLPIVLKGVLHPEDARLAVDSGVSALVVSNHGGRQLDTAAATIDQLPQLADAVGGRIPLLLDGGVRRGTDVAKALAAGADAVGIGRPVIWGLAVDGEQGVRDVLEVLRAELDHTLALCGGRCVADLTPDLLRYAPAVG